MPLIFLGIVTGSWLVLTQRKWLAWIMAWVSLTAVVFIAELGQLVLPERNFDWADVGWGAVGAFSGLALAATFTFLKKSARKPFA
ncbi:VanZ family protein [Spirosoma validum]|uniref:hypothetical protein n=1 Tax=Spirosoma validum TaxID=2771355 RepID=UPI001CC284AC|nr:hypothetical protein [Spirosoma validum]